MAEVGTMGLEVDTTRLTVRPGDRLVVRVSRPLDMEQADRLRGVLAEGLPGVEVVVVQADQLLVYRPDSEGG